MEKRVVKDIVDFFDGYELAHKLTTRSIDRFLHVFSVDTRQGVTAIKVIEKIKGKSDNMFYELRLEGNKASMIFRFNDQAKNFIEPIKKIAKPYFSISQLGKSLKVIILNPTLQDIQDTFIELEQHCRRREI